MMAGYFRRVCSVWEKGEYKAPEKKENKKAERAIRKAQKGA